MTSTCVENLEFDTEQRHRSAHFLPKLPPAVENTRKTVENVGQADRPVAENDGQVGIGVIMIRKMADDGRRPNPTRKYRFKSSWIHGSSSPRPRSPDGNGETSWDLGLDECSNAAGLSDLPQHHELGVRC